MKGRSMKSRIFAALLCASVLFPVINASAEVGGGIIIGEPTGLSLRIGHFPVLGIAWSLRADWMRIHADYWLLDRQLSYPLNWYVGVGGILGVGGGSVGVGARVPIGLLIPFAVKWEFFGELAPVIELVPDIGPDLDGGIGIRYFF
jgi:hypothetical protein